MTAFIYPAVVACVSVVIVIFLLSYVVPQVVTAFSQPSRKPPLLTRVMLALSGLRARMGRRHRRRAAAAIALWRYALRAPAARRAWHARVLRLPLAGRFVLGVNAARFASTLAILSGSGVALLTALEAARRTLGNDVLRLAVDDAAARVREGAPLSASLGAQKVFPSLLVHLIASGEKTGRLPELLDRGAQNLSRDLERRAMAMTALLEPALIPLMGIRAVDRAGRDDADPGDESAHPVGRWSVRRRPSWRRPPWPRGLQRLFVAFAGADADSLFDRRDEDLAVADLAGAGGLDDGFDGGFRPDLSGSTTSTRILGRKSTTYSAPRYSSVWPF